MRIGKVNQLVIAGYALLSLLMLMTLWVGDYFVKVKDATGHRREASLQLADQLLAGSKSLTNSVRSFAATGNPKYWQAYVDEQMVTRSRDLAVSGLQSLGITNDELDLIELAKANSDQLIHLEKRAFAAGDRGDLKLAVDLVYGKAYQDALTSIYQPIERFREALRDRLTREAAHAQRNVDLSRWFSRVLIVLKISIFAALLIGFYRRQVVKPLLSLNEQVQQELAGNPSVIIGHQHDRTEIGDLARSFAEFIRLEKRVYRQRHNKRQATELSLALQQTHDVEELASSLFSRLADLLGIRCGLLHFVDSQDDCLICAGGYGIRPDDKGTRTPFGEGLAGECAKSRLPMQFDHPPRDYLRISSATGSAPPEALLIRPLMLNDRLYGVIELATFRKLDDEDIELLEDLERIVVMNLANLDYQRRQASDSARIRVSEENLRAILNGITEGMFSLDRDGKLLFINPAACQFLGYEADELIGQPAHSRIHHTHPDGRHFPTEECPMYLTLQDALARTIDHDVMWRKDGTSIAIRYRTMPLFDSDGQCMGSVIAFNPIKP